MRKGKLAPTDVGGYAGNEGGAALAFVLVSPVRAGACGRGS
ncbi:hypothetical protein SBV1_820022 [Verrucomicrobia bacterium]|nr:hypothetical protein SBV1_820021 [Verrucomicrobiota bacterium]SPE62389.1 hypothetical protein SBV1_820022 [Verrucomicrobiota bacterium]